MNDVKKHNVTLSDKKRILTTRALANDKGFNDYLKHQFPALHKATTNEKNLAIWKIQVSDLEKHGKFEEYKNCKKISKRALSSSARDEISKTDRRYLVNLTEKVVEKTAIFSVNNTIEALEKVGLNAQQILEVLKMS